jgi:hypothetical protein
LPLRSPFFLVLARAKGVKTVTPQGAVIPSTEENSSCLVLDGATRQEEEDEEVEMPRRRCDQAPHGVDCVAARFVFRKEKEKSTLLSIVDSWE